MSKGRIVIFGWAESAHIQKWAAGLKSRGYDLLVISLGGGPVPDIETHIIPGSKLAPVSAAGRAARIARKFNPDLVHVHYASTFGKWGLKTDIKPLVVSVWGSDIVRFPSNWFKKGYLNKVLRRADGITATSRFLRDRVAALLPVPEAKLQVIPFGVDLPLDVRPLPDGPTGLLYLKSHKPVYGPHILLKAVAEAIKDVPDLKLTMAGGGSMTAELKALTERLNLAEHVEFIGFVPHDAVNDLIAGSHILVMPSLEEAFGVAALEASACGRPVIASNVGGTGEVVQDGHTGILVPPGDVSALAAAIVKLACDRSLCEKLGKAGYEFVKKQYLWERSLDCMEALYGRLIDEKA